MAKRERGSDVPVDEALSPETEVSEQSGATAEPAVKGFKLRDSNIDYPGRPVPREAEVKPLGTMASHPIMPGVTLISGMSGTGKSLLAYNIAYANAAPIYYFGEPYAYSDWRMDDLEATLDTFLSDESEDGPKILVVDSFKALVFAKGGAAGKGGINTSLFQMLTSLSIIASQRGKAIIGVINMMTDDKETQSLFMEAAVGSVVGYVHLTGVEVRDNVPIPQGRYKYRNGSLRVDSVVGTSQDVFSFNDGDAPDKLEVFVLESKPKDVIGDHAALLINSVVNDTNEED